MIKKQLLIMLLAPMMLVACNGGEESDSGTPLSFTCTQGETDIQYMLDIDEDVEHRIPNLEWSYNKKNWEKVDVVETYDYINIAHLKVGQTIYFRGNNPDGFCRYNSLGDFDTAFSFNFTNQDTAQIKIGGNIMSLLTPKNYDEKTDIPCDGCFNSLFDCFGATDEMNGGNVDASELLLPATELKEYTYLWLFSYANITKAPLELPATKAKKGCYEQMFTNCYQLITAPIIHLGNLEESSFRYTFRYCKQLDVVKGDNGATQFFTCPKLHGKYCVENMFYGTKQGEIPNPVEGEVFYYI